jgi:hypothetical protein
MDGSLFGLRQDCNGQSGIVKPALPFPRLSQQSGGFNPAKKFALTNGGPRRKFGTEKVIAASG